MPLTPDETGALATVDCAAAGSTEIGDLATGTFAATLPELPLRLSLVTLKIPKKTTQS
mgnify:FL=1